MLGNFEYGPIFWRDEKIYDIREDVWMILSMNSIWYMDIDFEMG